MSPSRLIEQNIASTLTYQVKSNEELCEGNGQRRQRVCFRPGEVPKDKHGETQGRYIWWLSNKRTHEGHNVWWSCRGNM